MNSLSLSDVKKVTPAVVKSAAKKLKAGKSDPVYSFSSDCIKVDSDKLAELLSIIIRCDLVHGHVTRFLLLATLVPIIKDKLGCINSSQRVTRPRLEFQDRDRDFYNFSLNIETETETEYFKVSMSRPRPRLQMSRLSRPRLIGTLIFQS